MVSKRKLSKSDENEDSFASDSSKIKKSRISSKKPKALPQDGVVENDSVFVQLLKSSGVTLRCGDRQNEISADQTVFQKKLQQSLKKHPRHPNVIQEFISGLESHIEDRDNLRNYLLPCGSIQVEESSTLGSSFHDSVIKLLLGIDILQGPVINTLFEKLPEFLYDSVGSDGINLPRLIINQFKWLDRIVDCKDLTSKIMQLVSVAPVEIQHDIITSLPEILEDSQHNDVARELNSLLHQNTQLTVPILDALSSLNLSTELLLEVRQSVMSTLSAVELEDLPVIIKFILHAVVPSDAVEVISELRRTLDLESCVSLTQMPTQSKMKSKSQASTSVNRTSASHDCVSLLMDVIKSAVRFQKHTSEAWLKAIESVDTVTDHKVTDLIVLMILYTTNTNSNKKQVERVLKNKIRMSIISDQLLQNAFKSHSQVLRDYFPSILSLAQTLLRSPEPSVVSFGSLMYKQAFSAFDSYCQQEIIGALVTHVCSGYASEVDVSLDVLTDLVSLHPAAVALYAVFVKGILDYLDNLNAQKIRKLFHILSMLAFSKGQEGSHIQDDMYIVIRKQLSSTVLKYKHIGIIGAVMMVGSMALSKRSPGSKNNEKSLSTDAYRQVTALLDLVRTCSEQIPEASALYYDELASLVQKRNLEPQVMDWVGKTVLEDFQDDFVVDLTPTVGGNPMFPVKAMFNLDEDESQGGIVINLLPLLSKDFSSKDTEQSTNNTGRLLSPICLSPFLRLLRLCIEEQNDGNLEEIDALLGCSLFLTDLDVTEKLESLSKQEREFLCSLLFFTINWFREIVNAFCKQQDPEMKGKVLTRLQNITWLQSVLEKCLAGSPGYVPPPAHFDSEAQEVAPAVLAPPPAKKPKKGKRKTSAEAKNSSADSCQLEEQQEMEQSEVVEKTQSEKEKEENGKISINLNNYRPYFRELGLEVFTVLQCGLLTRSVLDTEMHTKATEVVQLGPAELVFLLDDLSRKMEHILLSSVKKVTFLKVKGNRNLGFSQLRQKTTKEVAQTAVQLLNSLCNHMENMHNYFQTLMAEHNGVVDAPGVDVKEHQYMASCYQLLLQVFHTLFAWIGFSQHENRKLLKAALRVLAGRLKETETEPALEELVGQSFNYLQNLHSSVPTCSSALCLTQLLIVLAEKANAPHYQEKIALLAKQFLGQSWIQPSGEREKGIKYNETMQSLLCIYLDNTDDVLKAVEEISGVGVPELINTTKDGTSSTYPTLNRQTFIVFYRVLMDKLEKCVKNIPAGKKTEQLLRWNLAVRDFHILVNLVKVFDSRAVLNNCLKYGRMFVETFLKLGMPLLDFCFKKHREDVQSLLKTLQLSTRQLHHMCGHSKIHQDTGLTNHVPQLKKTLELFVFRVKAMLVLNNCQEAFWLGNLKNRDLQGEEILSQMSQETEAEEEQENLPAEEEEVEEEEENEESEKKVEDEEEEEESD